MVMSERRVKERMNLIRHSFVELADDRRRVRDIIDGGKNGLLALLGPRLKLRDTDIPALNMFESGATRLGHDLGQPPDTKADPWPTERGLTAEDQQDKADKRVRIIRSYDHRRLERQLRFQARWLPVYAYCVWVITERRDAEDNRYPVAEIRNPFTTYPAWWSYDEEPDEMVTVRKVPPLSLAELYPEKRARIENRVGDLGVLYEGQGYTVSQPGIEVIEYHSGEGTWVMMDSGDTVLDVVDNPLTTGPRFVIGRRPTVNRLIGQYNNAIGLMAHMAKLNVLALIATEDSVFRETNISGGLETVKYQRGRFAVNYLPPGASVDRPTGDFPVNAFEQINRLERQLRIQTQYPVTQDEQSPLSYATGEGIDRITAAGDRLLVEYRAILSETLELLDARRLEWDELMYPAGTKPMRGIHDGVAFFEDYTPSVDIRHQWQSRREYGPMAGIDEPTKIVAGLQLLQAGVIDIDTFREMLHSLGQLDRIRDNVRRDRSERAIFNTLEARASEGDPMAGLILAEIFRNPDSAGQTLIKFMTPEEPQMSPEEEAFLGGGGGGLEQMPDVQTVLSQLSQSGSPQGGGVQTVGRFG